MLFIFGPLAEKRPESPESQPDEPELFSALLIIQAAQLFAADHVTIFASLHPGAFH